MPLPRPLGARLAPRSVVAALVLALCAALFLAAAAPADAVTRKQASKKALAALGSKQARDPVIVFGLPKPLRAGTRVTQEGKKKVLARVGRERAFFFYQDAAPFQPFPHRGRVALVGAKSGKVKLTKTLTRRPLLNGRLPAFLKSARAYRDGDYVVYDGSNTSDAPAETAAAGDPFPLLVGVGNTPPTAHDQTVQAKQNSPKRITLTGSDPDCPPGSESCDLLTFEITKDANQGTLSGTPPDMTYTPDFGRLGPDHFFFTVSDGEATSKEGKITINVVPRGLPSVVTTSAGCTAYTEQAPAVVVDGAVAVSDPDDTVLDSAVVRIATNFEGGDDLLFTDQNGISGSYSDNTGSLALTGTATIAQYEAALRSVRYRNLASGNPAATKDIEFTVNDAGGDSLPATKQVCITPGTGTGGNDKPTGETSEGGLSYIENDGPVPVDGGFVVGDPDSANLSGATIKFIPVVTQEVDENGDPVGDPVVTETFAPAEDELAFVDQNGITGTYDDETGILTLTGTASLADYETAIRSVTYENSSEDPSDAIRRLQFQVTDSDGVNSTPSRRDIFITPVNDAPVVTTTAGPTTYTGSDPPVAIDSGLTVDDVDNPEAFGPPATPNPGGAQVRISNGFVSGDTLAFVDTANITGSYDSQTGVLTLTGTDTAANYQAALRSVTYSHSPGNPAGTRTVEFIVNDGDLDSEAASKTLELNDAPVLDTSDEALAYSEGDGSVAADPGITATDADTATLAGATVQISSGYVQGEDTLALAEQNGISGTFDADTGTLTVTGTATVAQYEDALGDVRYENSSENPSTATRTVTFRADDGQAHNNLSDPATRDITVTPVNDAPVVTTTAGSTAYTEGDPATAVDSGLTVADVDDTNIESAAVRISSGFESGDDLVFVDQSGISGVYNTGTGELTLSGSASLTDYETALRSIEFRHTGDNPAVSKTVEFIVNDGDADSAAATKDIAVTRVNDAPVVETSEGSTSYTLGDPSVVVDAGVTATDPDDANLESAQVRIASDDFEAGDQLELDEDSLAGGMAVDFFPATGILTVTGSASIEDYRAALAAVRFQHTGDNPSILSKTVEFTVNDGDAGSNTASKEIDLVAPNEAPVVTTSAGSSTYTLGDTTGVLIDDALTVTDADDANLEGAQVQIDDIEAGDELLFTDQNGITGTIDETGFLLLSGSSSVANYETALRSVRFRTLVATPGDRSVSFKVNDGTVDSAVAVKTIDLVAPLP